MNHKELTAKTEDRATYAVHPGSGAASEDAIVARALEILARRVRNSGDLMDSPDVVKQFLRLRVGALEHEEFGCMWLNTQHRLIEAGEVFRGTLTQASVFPREVVKLALHHNAAAVILYHNHPSGNTSPSSADEMLTRALKDALALVDVRVLDHFVVCAEACTSFAEKGLL